MSKHRERRLHDNEWDAIARSLEPCLDGTYSAAESGSPDAHAHASYLAGVIDNIRDGQPFGFTWEDVDMLREPYIYLNDLADRIEALLPPRTEP